MFISKDAGDYYNPPEYSHRIGADFELNIEEIIEDEDFQDDDLVEYTLKDFIPCDGNIGNYSWCDVEFRGKIVGLDSIWGITLNQLRHEIIYFHETEN